MKFDKFVLDKVALVKVFKSDILWSVLFPSMSRYSYSLHRPRDEQEAAGGCSSET
jgi:hypothetical protein